MHDFGWFELFVYALATWRITRIINRESGPGCVLEELRYRLGVRRGEDGRTITLDGSLARLSVCLKCLSVPVGSLICLIALASRSVSLAMCLPFALSTLAIVIAKLMPEE